MALLLDKYFLKLPIALPFPSVPLPESVLLFLLLHARSLFRRFHFLLPLLSFSVMLAKFVLAIAVLRLFLLPLPIESLLLRVHFYPDRNPILFHHLNEWILIPDFLLLPHVFLYQILYSV